MTKLTLIVLGKLYAELVVDVKGAFLTTEFDPKHKMYVTVPKGFKQYYPTDVLLLLLYGTKQAAIQFWKKLCYVMALNNAIHSAADSCLYFE
jgi:hypothetical protein